MVTSEFLPEEDRRRKKYENGVILLTESWKKDVLWMANVAIEPENLTSLWTGWNSLISSPNNRKHKVWYLPQINQSPTSHSVVAETMKRTIDIGKECGRDSVAVTYDLAIAKIAMQIQLEESPMYDSLFVAMGSFHIEMAFFSAIGKLIAESGGPHILIECGVLAKGSLKSLQSEKNYKRCKRIHEILAI